MEAFGPRGTLLLRYNQRQIDDINRVRSMKEAGKGKRGQAYTVPNSTERLGKKLIDVQTQLACYAIASRR